ncbi:MAG TPA: DNA-binding protein [Lachnospiraceae bacterium]|nr:DNA-binding protein [Lachnospiraceae bacterium]
MEFKEFRAKSVEDALTAAALEFSVASDELETEIVDRGSTGFLGLGSKPAIIKARVKNDITRDTKEYLEKIFAAMETEVSIEIQYDKEGDTMDIDLEGPEMGILIGKRGQTLDSLQYLVSLFVNKKSESYIRVKLNTENYRERRKETLENLAKNIAFKVKRTRKSFTLEPMNPYERRIIHSTLQNDKFVATKSEGEEPYRKVVVFLKKGNKSGGRKKDYNKDYTKNVVKEEKPKKPAYDYGDYDISEINAETAIDAAANLQNAIAEEKAEA